jgi:hypothetical protein
MSRTADDPKGWGVFVWTEDAMTVLFAGSSRGGGFDGGGGVVWVVWRVAVAV